MQQDEKVASDQPTQFDGAQARHYDGDVDAWAPGARIGRYRVIEVIGEGGMGKVYLAEQVAPVRRKVALKTIRSSHRDPLLEAMFAVEAQALAQVEHPAVARIYEVGRSEQGESFLALEWVDGVALDQYIQQHAPSLATRLHLLRRVCLGVHHAHQRGVIHRDIKPANILVVRIDGRPEPKLIDFGIAVAHARSINAQVTGAGSLGYMAPEQALPNAAPDVRADVYSLGMTMLAALLADALPQGLASQRMQTLRELLEDSTSRLGARASLRPDAELLGRMPMELRAILRRALAEDPAARYPSALALAEDIDCYLTRRPVAAVAGSPLYAVGKFVSRHRLWIGAAALAVCALLGGLTLALRGMVQARQAQMLAESAAEQARREAMRSQLLARFLGEVLGGITPEEARGQDTTLLRRIFDRAGQRAQDELAADPLLQFEFAAMMGANLRLLGDSAEAATRLEQLLQSLPEQSAADPSALRARRHLVQARWELGQDAAAAELAEETLQLARQRYGETHIETLNALSELAWVQQADALPQAVQRIEEAASAARTALAEDDPARLEILSRQASLLTMAGQLAPAMSRFDEVLPLLQRRLGPEHPKVLTLQAERGIVLLREKRHADAEAVMQPLLEPIERLYGPDHGVTLTLINNLGAALRQQGKSEQAAPLYERSFATWLRLHGRKHPNTMIAAINLALLRRDQGQVAEGLCLHRETTELAAETFAPQHRIWSRIHLTQARLLAAAGSHTQALEDYERAYELAAEQLGADSKDTQEIVADALQSLRAISPTPALAQRWESRLAQ